VVLAMLVRTPQVRLLVSQVRQFSSHRRRAPRCTSAACTLSVLPALHSPRRRSAVLPKSGAISETLAFKHASAQSTGLVIGVYLFGGCRRVGPRRCRLPQAWR
jgi:hypothetical protein